MMDSKIEVSRELLKRAACNLGSGCEAYRVQQELVALLAATVPKPKYVGSLDFSEEELRRLSGVSAPTCPGHGRPECATCCWPAPAGYTAVDVATAAADGYRDGVAHERRSHKEKVVRQMVGDLREYPPRPYAENAAVGEAISDLYAAGWRKVQS